MTDTAQETQVATTRNIKVLPTGGQKFTFAFSGTTWAELRAKLRTGGTDINGKSFSGLNLENMKAVESANRHTLDHEAAVVPTTDFNLFLLPMKVKSGSGRRSELMVQIKELIEADATAKEFFGKYTNLKTNVIEDLMKQYTNGNTKSAANSEQKKKSVSKAKAEGIAGVVGAVKDSKKEDADADLYEELQALSIPDQLFLIIKLVKELGSKVGVDVAGELKDGVKEVAKEPAKAEVKESEEDRKKREEKEQKERLQKLEDEEDAKMMSELAGGLSDVDRNKVSASRR